MSVFVRRAARAPVTLGLSLGLVGLGAMGCAPTPPPNSPTETPMKVGFIYVGPIGDYGWSKAHEDGRQYLENFGTLVTTKYVESVTQAQAPQVIDDLVAEGHELIFTTSFDFLEAATDASQRHSDVTMLNCSGFKTGERLGSYQARIEETEYLSGMVAGAMTQTNKIGVVAGLRIYEQMMHINAFTLGVKRTNPNAEVVVRWVGFWFDPDKESKAVDELVDQANVDVIKAFTDTNVPIHRTKEINTPSKTVYAIAHGNKDGCTAAPDICLVSSYYNWGPLYVKLAEEVRTGAYPANGRVDYVSLADLDVSGLSPFADAVPTSVRDEVAQAKQDIVERKLNVFQGPIDFADGSSLPEGSTLTDDQLICTSTYVAGITDLPGPSCTVDADCENTVIPGLNNMTCEAGQCVAKDFSGCPE